MIEKKMEHFKTKMKKDSKRQFTHTHTQITDGLMKKMFKPTVRKVCK